MARVVFETLGCRLNQAETAQLTDAFAAAGYDLATAGDAAEVYVFNTCTVTARASAKCRQAIRRVLRQSPDAFVAVIGCYAESGQAQLAEWPGVNLIVGNADKHRLVELVDAGLHGDGAQSLTGCASRGEFTLPGLTADDRTRTRAFLKVQDGCDVHCAYCIVPSVRGPARSRALPDVLAEAERLLARGYRELVLTGIHIGAYRSGGQSLIDLVDALLTYPSLQRLRVSSIEPTRFPWGLLERMAAEPDRVCPHLHLPMQSGSERVLRAMGRPYNLAEARAIVEAAAERVPGIHLATDLMVGFPGETDDDFEDTCRLLTDWPFAYAHIFRYSPREGTRAAVMPDAVPGNVAQERARRLQTLSDTSRKAFHAGFIGRELPVLAEHWDAVTGLATGLTPHYVRVDFSAPGPVTNTLVTVAIRQADADRLHGEVVAANPAPDGV